MEERDDWLPPGQTATRKFPVVGERAPAAGASLDPGTWTVRVDGLVKEPREWTAAMIRAMPAAADRVVDIHCVTGWSHRAMRWTGLPAARLIDAAEPLPDARFVRFVARSEHDHDTTLPLELVRADTWIAWARDGEDLAVEHGGPLRTVTPSRYFYKSLKWLRRIELLAEDQLGTWESESSYHQVGDPWEGDQRFATGSLSPDRLEAFRTARSFAPWRGPRKVLLGLSLREWEPATRELGALQLKHCDLRRARLAGVDLRSANLSLSDLREADLREADLREADLEGLDLRGADLRGADLRGAALTAARFVGGGGEPARVAGLSWSAGSGLLEEQEEFLVDAAGPPSEPESGPGRVDGR